MSSDMTRLLVARLRSLLADSKSERKLCVLIGAGATSPVIPAVATLTERARGFADERDTAGTASAATPVAAPGGIQDLRIRQYTESLQLVKQIRGPEGVRTFIQRAVLNAYRPGIPTSLQKRPLTDAEFGRLEANAENWTTPEGLNALADVIKEYPTRFCDHLLTTNFDPLIEIAMRRCGLAVRAYATPADLPPHGFRLAPNERLIVHLHGDSRGTTLHSPAELERPRPALERWLRTHLQAATLLVVGYSGWDDILSRVLGHGFDDPTSADPDTATDIAWAVYEDEATHGHINPTLAAFFRANPAHVVPYYGVDRDRLFIDLQEAMRTTRDRSGNEQAPSAANFYVLVKRLNSEFGFGYSPISRTMVPKLVFWPHRLRQPHLIHGVHAVAAVMLAKLGLSVELYLDDTNMRGSYAEPLVAEFEEAVNAWFAACRAPSLPTIHRYSAVLAARSDPERSAKLWQLATELYSPVTTAFDALVATKVIEAEDEVKVIRSPAHRLLRPLYTWYVLDEALARYQIPRGQVAPAVTLGGQDGQKMWDLWRTRTDVPSVASVYVPRLESPAEGTELWKYQQLRRDAPFRERDLGNFIRLAQADRAGGETLLEWLYTVGVRLPATASDGATERLQRDGAPLGSWFNILAALRSDPVGASETLAGAISAWFHADGDDY